MRRRKEGSKVEARKSFQRCVGSVSKLLLKYTNEKLEDVFEVVETEVKVPANHHGAPRRVREAQVAANSMDIEDELDGIMLDSFEDQNMDKVELISGTEEADENLKVSQEILIVIPAHLS